MRIDVVTIFPEYLNALDVSLMGKARADGLLDIRVHDLRDFTFDRHHTVDDTPYGGGAGMVMKPEPWALALESIAQSAAEDQAAETDSTGSGAEINEDSSSEPNSESSPVRPTLLVPTPSGQVFKQQTAVDLAQEKHLVIACGRYEGIDERLFEWAQEYFEVKLVSLGDYVLNGGEVAALAMVEAIGRLVPGVVGNPESLVEESHSDGLLEYPVYTKPSVWRDHEVPEILLSGDHGKIAQWRADQQVERTRRRRPELLD